MNLLKNQTYSLKLKFVKNSDEEQKIGVNISVTCNHEIPKDILQNIENKVNELLLTDYQKKEDFDKKQKLEKDQEKEKEKIKKLEETNKKLQIRKMELEGKKMELEYMKTKKDMEKSKMINFVMYNI